MSLIYERLYLGDRIGAVRIGPYLGELSHALLEAYDIAGSTIEVRDRRGALSLGLEKAVPLALILNELLCNSLKYASSSARPCAIVVSLEGGSDRASLTVSDDGPGFPEGFEPERATGMGFGIMRMLSAQLGASFAILPPSGRGAGVKLTLPLA